ncbi:unnamed protein product [Toxocara canis]|uniref:Uncharacterized protein n=1 Tax=Toxocara canis TaxID=6265 RepID=A0A183U2E9_TOXCA|nr:unnamed protein product [Toxocara canis]
MKRETGEFRSLVPYACPFFHMRLTEVKHAVTSPKRAKPMFWELFSGLVMPAKERRVKQIQNGQSQLSHDIAAEASIPTKCALVDSSKVDL